MLTQSRIVDWYRHFSGAVCVSFSGGKDSTVLLRLVREQFPDVPAVFGDTGLEFPEIRAFAKRFDNVDFVRPKMRFDEVISTYGYPLIGKEVAEAIYYARRIRSQSLNVERERERRHLAEAARTHRTETERKRDEFLGYRANGSGWNWGGRSLNSSRREQRRACERSSKESCDKPG